MAAENNKKLIDCLELVGEQVRQDWKTEWGEKVRQTSVRLDRIFQQPLVEGSEYVPGETSSAILTLAEDGYTPIFPNLRTDELPGNLEHVKNNSTSVGFSMHNVYPDYFSKLVEALRADDFQGYLDFMSDEGSKWALVEVPVDELTAQTASFNQILVGRIYTEPGLDCSADERRELAREADRICRASQAALLKGYVEGRDRLLVRALSSNHPLGQDVSISPIVKGTIMGGFGEQVRRSLDELEALHKVNSAANSSLDQDSVLDLTVKAVAEVMSVDVCSIYVFERDPQSGGEKMILRAAQGLNPKAIGVVEAHLGEGVTGIAAKEGKPVSVYDIWADNRFRYVPQLKEDSSRSMLSVPVILYTREKLVGVINVQSTSYRSWTTEEVRFLEMVAGAIALAIENARLYQHTDERYRQKVQELASLQKVSNLIAATLDIKQVLNLIVEQAPRLVGAEIASIYELKEDTKYLTIIAAHGLSEDYIHHMRVKLGEGPVGRAAERNRPVNVWDAHFELHEGEEYYLKGQYRSSMCVPLAGPRGVLGVICLYTQEQRHFNDEQLQVISAFADQAAIAIENARLYEAARRGLSIKSALLQEMHHRVRNNLQTVAALLSMQMRRANNMAVAMPLAESVARIQSIAAVHDLLCRDDIGVTTVDAVAKEITDIASISLVPPELRIRFKIDGNKVPIASKEATLLAILIMELISNSIFHGFNDKSEGEIRVSAFVNEGRTQVEIRDNGHGYPPDFDPSNGKHGLGLQIVHTLVTKDLQGTFRMENINGWATATIIFNSVYSLVTDNEINTGLIA